MNKENYKEGDLFWWSYTVSEYEKRKDSVNAGTLYWCVSRIFRFNGTNFVDTYWHGSDNKTWTPEQAEKQLDLIFLANENNLEKTQTPEYYDNSDIVNLNHPNSSKGNIYVKKAASRSKKAMSEYANKKLEDANYDKRRAEREVELYANKLQEIENSDDLDNIWI